MPCGSDVVTFDCRPQQRHFPNCLGLDMLEESANAALKLYDGEDVKCVVGAYRS